MMDENRIFRTAQFICSSAYDAAFTYSTIRVAKIHSFPIAFMYRIIQLCIIGYIVGWSIVYEKGYQEIAQISSSVSTKVKGLGFIEYEPNQTVTHGVKLFTNSNNYIRVFDTADYTIPPSEYNSIFVMTNFVETMQTQGLCDEDYLKINCTCKTDEDCMKKIQTSNSWNGIPTGKCIQSSINMNVSVCEIASWCPVEHERKDKRNLIQNVNNFTIFIKNDVKFEAFNKRERNLLEEIDNNYIATCTYEPIRDPFCPVFLIEEIMREAEPDPQERIQMLQTGGLIRILIDWNCNYDYFSKQCLPKYTFDRFDVSYKQNSSASGFNFRFSDKFEKNETSWRVLTKAYGLKFVITVTGKAGKFSFLPLLLTLGSGMGLLALATIITDIIVLNVMKKKNFYKKLKELNYKDEDSKDFEKSISVMHGSRNSVFQS